MRERRRLVQRGGLALAGVLLTIASGGSLAGVGSLAAPATARAQEEGAGHLVGLVTAADGGPLAGAVITVSSAALPTGDASLTTDEAGRFRLGLIPPGLYDVAVELPGYRRGLLGGLKVEDGRTTDASLVLERRAGGEDGY